MSRLFYRTTPDCLDGIQDEDSATLWNNIDAVSPLNVLGIGTFWKINRSRDVNARDNASTFRWQFPRLWAFHLCGSQPLYPPYARLMQLSSRASVYARAIMLLTTFNTWYATRYSRALRAFQTGENVLASALAGNREYWFLPLFCDVSNIFYVYKIL